jgi:hypothetical protein
MGVTWGFRDVASLTVHPLLKKSKKIIPTNMTINVNDNLPFLNLGKHFIFEKTREDSSCLCDPKITEEI